MAEEGAADDERAGRRERAIRALDAGFAERG